MHFFTLIAHENEPSIINSKPPSSAVSFLAPHSATNTPPSQQFLQLARPIPFHFHIPTSSSVRLPLSFLLFLPSFLPSPSIHHSYPSTLPPIPTPASSNSFHSHFTTSPSPISPPESLGGAFKTATTATTATMAKKRSTGMTTRWKE